MRIVHFEEWNKLMNEAIKETNMEDIKLLWDGFLEIQRKGYFTLPF